MSNIRNKANLAASAIEYSHYNDCFPGKIKAGDVDFEVELNGFLLRVEFKHAGDILGEGYRIKHRVLSVVPHPAYALDRERFKQYKGLPMVTIFAVWGRYGKAADDPFMAESCEVWVGDVHYTREVDGHQDLVDMMTRWKTRALQPFPRFKPPSQVCGNW